VSTGLIYNLEPAIIVKSKTWVWVTLATALALGIGVIAFQSAFGFASAIVFDGACYPPRGRSAPLALSWTRDLSGKLGQLFQSEYSHLYRISFSIDGRLVAPLIHGGPPDVQCKLYELSEEPKHVALRQNPTPSSAFWATAICEEKYSRRTVFKQTRDLVRKVFKENTLPLAHVVGQTFAATQNGLCGITTILGSGPQKDHGKLAFHIWSNDDPNKDLFTQEIDASDISEQQVITFHFDPIEDSRFKRYGFYLTSPDCGPLQAPRILATKTDIEPNGEAWRDYRPQLYDVVFKAQYCGASHESLQVPPGIIVQQLADVDIKNYDAVREGSPSYRGSENNQYKAVFEFPAIVGSSNGYYFFILEINGVSVPCGSFLCQHSAGTLPETLRHIVGTLMIDKPPCIKKEHIIVLACLLFFLIAVFVNCLGLPASCKRASTGQDSDSLSGRRSGDVK